MGLTDHIQMYRFGLATEAAYNFIEDDRIAKSGTGLTFSAETNPGIYGRGDLTIVRVTSNDYDSSSTENGFYSISGRTSLGWNWAKNLHSLNSPMAFLSPLSPHIGVGLDVYVGDSVFEKSSGYPQSGSIHPEAFLGLKWFGLGDYISLESDYVKELKGPDQIRHQILFTCPLQSRQ